MTPVMWIWLHWELMSCVDYIGIIDGEGWAWLVGRG
jgi:hypothetical protein